MTTRDRLNKYHQLFEENPAAAKTFLEQESADRRFVSLIQHEEDFMDALTEILDEEC